MKKRVFKPLNMILTVLDNKKVCSVSIREMMLRQAPGTLSTYNGEGGEPHRCKSDQRPQERLFPSKRNEMQLSI